MFGSVFAKYAVPKHTTPTSGVVFYLFTSVCIGSIIVRFCKVQFFNLSNFFLFKIMREPIITAIFTKIAIKIAVLAP